MNEEIRYWRGKRIEQLSQDELRQALAEVYRELEQLSWLVHTQRQIIEKGAKKPVRAKKAEEAELADVA